MSTVNQVQKNERDEAAVENSQNLTVNQRQTGKTPSPRSTPKLSAAKGGNQLPGNDPQSTESPDNTVMSPSKSSSRQSYRSSPVPNYASVQEEKKPLRASVGTPMSDAPSRPYRNGSQQQSQPPAKKYAMSAETHQFPGIDPANTSSNSTNATDGSSSHGGYRRSASDMDSASTSNRSSEKAQNDMPQSSSASPYVSPLPSRPVTKRSRRSPPTDTGPDPSSDPDRTQSAAESASRRLSTGVSRDREPTETNSKIGSISASPSPSPSISMRQPAQPSEYMHGTLDASHGQNVTTSGSASMRSGHSNTAYPASNSASAPLSPSIPKQGSQTQYASHDFRARPPSGPGTMYSRPPPQRHVDMDMHHEDSERIGYQHQAQPSSQSWPVRRAGANPMRSPPNTMSREGGPPSLGSVPKSSSSVAHENSAQQGSGGPDVSGNIPPQSGAASTPTSQAYVHGHTHVHNHGHGHSQVHTHSHPISHTHPHHHHHHHLVHHHHTPRQGPGNSGYATSVTQGGPTNVASSSASSSSSSSSASALGPGQPSNDIGGPSSTSSIYPADSRYNTQGMPSSGINHGSAHYQSVSGGNGPGPTSGAPVRVVVSKPHDRMLALLEDLRHEVTYLDANTQSTSSDSAESNSHDIYLIEQLRSSNNMLLRQAADIAAQFEDYVNYIREIDAKGHISGMKAPLVLPTVPRVRRPLSESMGELPAVFSDHAPYPSGPPPSSTVHASHTPSGAMGPSGSSAHLSTLADYDGMGPGPGLIPRQQGQSQGQPQARTVSRPTASSYGVYGHGPMPGSTSREHIRVSPPMQSQPYRYGAAGPPPSGSAQGGPSIRRTAGTAGGPSTVTTTGAGVNASSSAGPSVSSVPYNYNSTRPNSNLTGDHGLGPAGHPYSKQPPATTHSRASTSEAHSPTEQLSSNADLDYIGGSPVSSMSGPPPVASTSFHTQRSMEVKRSPPLSEHRYHYGSHAPTPPPPSAAPYPTAGTYESRKVPNSPHRHPRYPERYRPYPPSSERSFRSLPKSPSLQDTFF